MTVGLRLFADTIGRVWVKMRMSPIFVYHLYLKSPRIIIALCTRNSCNRKASTVDTTIHR